MDASTVVVCVEDFCKVTVEVVISLAVATGVTSTVVVAVTRDGPSGDGRLEKSLALTECARPPEIEAAGAE